MEKPGVFYVRGYSGSCTVSEKERTVACFKYYNNKSLSLKKGKPFHFNRMLVEDTFYNPDSFLTQRIRKAETIYPFCLCQNLSQVGALSI